MKILLVAATSFELAGIIKHFDTHFNKISFFEYAKDGLHIFPLVTGIGALKTAFAISRHSKIEDIDLAINVGVCGLFDTSKELGHTVEITSDRFADLGVEEADGTFTDVFEMQLEVDSHYPFNEGVILNNENKYRSNFPKVSGITVNKVTGTEETKNLRRNKYDAHVESMEGAGFLFACKMLDVDCIQLRSTSNHVEKRNKEHWKLEEALDSLTISLLNYLETLKNNINQPQV